MKYLSLFSGIGGFELGIGQLAKCVGFSEINPYAIQIYQYRFPDAQNFGDITKIDPKTLPPFDALVGGFPCQSFSVIGKRKGFNDPRGVLFFEILRIIRQTKPSLLFFENVKGLVNHEGGKTFATILRSLDELGYDCQWQVLDSKNFGVPQSRQRVYIIGHLRGTPRPEVFPLCGENKQGSTGNRSLKSCLPFAHIRDGSKKGYAVAEVGDCIDLSFANSATRKGRVTKDISHAVLPSMEIYTLTKEAKIRRLTPVEAERLQGFPDHWTAKGIKNGKVVAISDRQRYQRLGNAVTVPVIRAIARKLLRKKKD